MIVDEEALEQDQPIRKHGIFSILYVQVIIAIIIGILLGWLWPDIGEAMKPFGDGFIKLVKMIIAPVIFLTVVIGIAGTNDMRSVGRVAAKAMVYFIFFSTLALILGMVVANVLQPGHGLNVDPSQLDTSKVSTYVEGAKSATLTHFIMDIIPTTVLSPLVQSNILQVLFIAILFGSTLLMLGERGKPAYDIVRTFADPIFKMVELLMRLAPIGAFGAMAFVVGKYGISSLANLFYLVFCFYVTSLLFVLIVLGAVGYYNGFSIIRLIVYIKEELLLVLGTSSSEAALPSLMRKMEKAGCDKAVVGMVIPTGYSFNLDGTNIYMTMAALFIAQACNIDLTIEHQIILLLTAMVSSKGAAGVTGAGFIILAATLSVVPELPVEGMALILGIDRFMSECRALTNLVGNACATLVIARWENKLDKDMMRGALNAKKQVIAA